MMLVRRKMHENKSAFIRNEMQPVDVYVTRLSNPMAPVLSLSIHRRIPVWVVEDDRVGSGQVHADAAGPRRQNEAEDALVCVESLHQHLTLFNLDNVNTAELALWYHKTSNSSWVPNSSDVVESYQSESYGCEFVSKSRRFESNSESRRSESRVLKNKDSSLTIVHCQPDCSTTSMSNRSWVSNTSQGSKSLKGKKGKGAYSSLWTGNPSQSYGVPPAIWDHSVTCHPTQVNVPRLNPSHAGWYSMEGWVDHGVGYTPRWFTCPQTVTHPGTNHFTPTWPGVEHTTSRSQVQCLDRYTTKPPIHLSQTGASIISLTIHVTGLMLFLAPNQHGSNEATKNLGSAVQSQISVAVNDWGLVSLSGSGIKPNQIFT